MKYVNFCLVVIISLFTSAGSVKNDVPSVGYYPGEAIPDIVLTDLEGDSYNLSEFKGKKVVVNMWASYDAQSRADNVRLHNIIEMTDSDISFLSIAFDENINVIERTTAMDSLNKKSLFCEVSGSDSELYRELKLNRGFRNYLIDENGVITSMNFTPEELKAII